MLGSDDQLSLLQDLQRFVRRLEVGVDIKLGPKPLIGVDFDATDGQPFFLFWCAIQDSNQGQKNIFGYFVFCFADEVGDKRLVAGDQLFVISLRKTSII